MNATTLNVVRRCMASLFALAFACSVQASGMTLNWFSESPSTVATALSNEGQSGAGTWSIADGNLADALSTDGSSVVNVDTEGASDSPLAYAPTASASGVSASVEIDVCFSNSVDTMSVPLAGVQAAITIVKDGESAFRFAYVVGGAWATNETIAVTATDTYTIKVAFDYEAWTVTYSIVDGEEIATGALSAQARVTGASFLGAGSFASFAGTYVLGDAVAMIESGATTNYFDTFNEAYVAATAGDTIVLLADAEWSSTELDPTNAVSRKNVAVTKGDFTLTINPAVSAKFNDIGYKCRVTDAGVEVGLPFAGAGTEASPWEIGDYATLVLFKNGVNAESYGKSGEFFKLTADIDFADVDGNGTAADPWPGVGFYGKWSDSDKDYFADYEAKMRKAAFIGTFDGDGHTIKNLFFSKVPVAPWDPSDDEHGYCGFFNSVFHATVKNLSISLGGSNGWVDDVQSGTFGGGVFVGSARDSLLQNLETLTTGTADTFKTTHATGGIVAMAYSNTVVKACTNNLKIVSSTSKFGGIACICEVSTGDYKINFQDCVNNGDLEATAKANNGVAGLVGYNTVYIKVSNFVNNGTITVANTDGMKIGNIAGYVSAANRVEASGTNKGLAAYQAVYGYACANLKFATVEGGVATYVADDAVVAGPVGAAPVYHVTAPLATFAFAFTGEGAVAFDKTGYTTFAATVTAPNGYAVATNVAENVTTYTAAVVDYTIAYQMPGVTWAADYTAPVKFAVTNVVTFPTAADVVVPATHTFGGWTNAQGVAFAATSANYFENLTLIAKLAEKAKGSEDNPWAVGDGLTAVTNNGVLVISGSGTMTDYSEADVPWADALDEIDEIDIEDGVVVAAGAFKGLTTEQTVVFAVADPVIAIAAFGEVIPDVKVDGGTIPLGWKGNDGETYESIAAAKTAGAETVTPATEAPEMDYIFNGKIQEGWPTVAWMKGAWCDDATDLASYANGELSVATEESTRLDFTATNPQSLDEGSVDVCSSIKFSATDPEEFPEIPADAKSGLVLGADNYYYGVTNGAWGKLEALGTGSEDEFVDVIVTMMTSGVGKALKVRYTVISNGGATTNSTELLDATMPAGGAKNVKGVSYQGDGAVKFLAGYYVEAAKEVELDGVGYATFDEAYLAATNGATIKLLMNATWSAVPAAGIALKAINLDLNGKTLTVADAVKNAAAAKGYKVDGATVKLPFAGGDGTEANPYTIGDYETLDLFRNGVNAGSYGVNGEYFQQTANISFEGKPTWAGITLFKANYDGNGKAITGLVLDGGNTYRGFFTETMNATVKNLTVEMGAGDAFLDPAGNTIAEKSGFDLGDYDNTDPTAFGGAAMVGKANTGSTFIGCTTKGDIAGTHNAGGFVTRFYGDCHFIDCTNEVNTIGTYTKVGGFAVIVQNAGSEIVRCVNKGNVRTYGDEMLTDSTKSPGCDGVGGILAYNSATVTIKDCVNEGTVSSDAAEVKGSDNPTEPATLPRVGALVGFSSGNKATLLGTNTVADSMLAIGAAKNADHYADFALATVENGVATLPATVEVDGEYKVMAPVASVTFEFTEAGSISFNTNLCLTFTANITATEDFTVTTSGEPPVVVYTAEANYAMEYDGHWVSADEATAIIENKVKNGETVTFTFYAKVDALGCTFVAGSVLDVVDGLIWGVTSENDELITVSNVAVRTQAEVDAPVSLSGTIEVSKTSTAPNTILWLTEGVWLNGDVLVGKQVAEAVKLFLGAEAQAPIAQLVLDGTLTPGDFKLKVTRYGEVWSLAEIDDAVEADDEIGCEIRKEFDSYTGYYIYTAVVKGAKNAIAGETVIDAADEDAALKIAADSVVKSEDAAANEWLDAHGKTLDYRALWTIEVSAGGAADKWKLTPTLLTEVKDALQAAVNAASAQIADVKENRMVVVETLPGVRYGVVSAASVEELATKTEPEAWTIGTGDNVNLAVEVFEGKTFFKVVAKP